MPKVVAQKKDWLKLGYLLFSKEGIKGIVVENMAKTLNCNKSSFYWHFKSRAIFLRALIEYWIQTETNQIIELVEAQKTPQKKYHKFIELVFQHDPYLEFIFHLKRYAREHPKIQKLIEEVDQKRLDYTTGIFQELGFPKKESRRIASIFYKYLIGFHEIYREKAADKKYQKLVKEELAYILKRKI